MRTSSPASNVPAQQALGRRIYHFGSDEESDERTRRVARFDKAAAARDELPYRVELWDDAKKSVAQVLAVAANGSIGYAAFYAATREHPDRYITLRHNNSIMSRWNGPDH